jgi:hypothetical protein
MYVIEYVTQWNLSQTDNAVYFGAFLRTLRIWLCMFTSDYALQKGIV